MIHNTERYRITIDSTKGLSTNGNPNSCLATQAGGPSTTLIYYQLMELANGSLAAFLVWFLSYPSVHSCSVFKNYMFIHSFILLLFFSLLNILIFISSSFSNAEKTHFFICLIVIDSVLCSFIKHSETFICSFIY